MDIMDIQAVESKLNDVTVTPIPRSQVQNFYNYQQQREQREQQPQIQISAIHHARGSSANDRLDSLYGNSNISISSSSGGGSKQRDYTSNAAVTAAAIQYTQQLQAQLALLQQQSNTSALPASLRSAAASSSSSNNGIAGSNSASIAAASAAAAVAAVMQSQIKYPQSTSPVVITTQTSSNITTPMTSTANLPQMSGTPTGNGLSKYAQLLSVIEEMGRDIRPTYTGSRSSTERLKRGLVHARILVRECLMETERSARQ